MRDIIVGYMWQILGRGPFLPPSHLLAATKRPILNRVKISYCVFSNNIAFYDFILCNIILYFALCSNITFYNNNYSNLVRPLITNNSSHLSMWGYKIQIIFWFCFKFFDQTSSTYSSNLWNIFLCSGVTENIHGIFNPP